MSHYIETELLSITVIPNGLNYLIQMTSGKGYLNLIHR